MQFSKGNTQPKDDRYNKTSPTGLSQRLRTHLPKTSHHTHAPPNSLPPQKKEKTFSQAGTTPSITLHGPPADHLHTNSSHPTTTIDHQGNPRRHVNGSVATKHKHASFYCDFKNLNKGNITNLQLNPHLFSRNSIISMMLSDNESNCRAVCLLIWNYIFKASVSFKLPLFRVPSIFPVRYLSANCLLDTVFFNSQMEFIPYFFLHFLFCYIDNFIYSLSLISESCSSTFMDYRSDYENYEISELFLITVSKSPKSQFLLTQSFCPSEFGYQCFERVNNFKKYLAVDYLMMEFCEKLAT